MDDIKKHVDRIDGFLLDGFEKELFKAIIRYVDVKDEALRINIFAFGARELITIVLDRLAPDSCVANCLWFKQAPNLPPGKGTRAQKVRYAIIGELCSEYVRKVFDIDLGAVEACITDEYSNLSKYTHIREDVFFVNDKENILILESLSSLNRFFSIILDTSRKVEDLLYEELRSIIYFEITEKHMDVFSHLAWITCVEDVYIDDVVISKSSDRVYCDVFGSASVELECGRSAGESRDDCYLGTVSCSFEVSATCPVTNLKEIELGEFEITTPY